MARSKRPALKTILNQKSYQIQTQQVSMAVAELGGFMAPVRFFRDTKMSVEPLAVAPWHGERLPKEIPPILKGLRGDFFCMPFGGGPEAYRGRAYPPHGETANRIWKFADLVKRPEGAALHLDMALKLQPGKVEKALALVEGQNMIYSRHRISGLSGKMTYAHHATLKFPDRPGSGRLSFSPFRHAATYHSPVESPEVGTYSILKPDSVITDLTRVPLIDGRTTDLTLYPARRGYEDLAMICADPDLEMAWSAVTFSEEGYVWFNLKDPKVLASTVLWFTNGGRYAAPWNGRHINVMGMEETTTFWGDGIAASARKNALSERGIVTARTFKTSSVFDVPVMMGVARIPSGFKVVREIQVRSKDEIRLVGNGRHRVDVPAYTGFLRTGKVEGLIGG